MAANGYLLALTRDEAKRLFALRGEEAMWAFVAEMMGDESMKTAGRMLSCGHAWVELHEACLHAVPASLEQAVLGGRALTHEESRGQILLKRPDVVALLAAELSSQAQPSLADLAQFYIRAAEQKCAVLFATENKVDVA